MLIAWVYVGGALLLALFGLALFINVGGIAEDFLHWGRILPPGAERIPKNARFTGLAMMVMGLAWAIGLLLAVTR